MQQNYYNVVFLIRLRRKIHSEHFEIKSKRLKRNIEDSYTTENAYLLELLENGFVRNWKELREELEKCLKISQRKTSMTKMGYCCWVKAKK